jgi:hypothetical protein
MLSINRAISLVQYLLQARNSCHKVSFEGCRGHTGNTDHEDCEDGFSITGQYPIDFRKGANLCPTVKDLSKTQYEKVQDSVETLASIFRECRVLTVADMDGEDIMKMSDDSRKTRKDERVRYQQRAALMISAECVRQYKDYQQRLQVKNASTGRVGSFGGTKGPTDTELYNSWFLTLTHHHAREDVMLYEAVGGNVSQRKQKAAELRAQGWTSPFQIQEN